MATHGVSVLGWRRLVVALVAIACTSWASVGARAQTASIEGRVTDPQGGALVGATVTVSAPGRTPEVEITDESGAYRVAALPSGVYTVTVTLSGFRTARLTGVSLGDAATETLDIELTLAPFGQSVDVVGVAPGLGSGVSRDRLPGTVAVVGADELAERLTPSLSDALNERLGAVTLEGATTNLFQPTVRFRGFTASPLLGLPQGVAVYQNGVRINEPFGDTVQFDLIPQFAVSQMQLSAGTEPTYGLNALGGALALRLKNGFDDAGLRGEVSGGSFGRVTGTAEWGDQIGPWGIYLGATGFDEDGWRDHSASTVTQAVADVAYRQGRVDAGVSFTYADSDLNGNGAAPIELLEVDRSAVFTFPDNTQNRLAFTQGRFNMTLSATWSIQATGYYRDLDRTTLNGDEAEFGVCDDDFLPLGAPANTLCLGDDDDDDDDDGTADGDGDLAGAAFGGARRAVDDDDDPVGMDNDDDDDDDEEGEQRPLVDAGDTTRFITEDDAAGDAAFNRTSTRTQGYGASLQAVATSTVGERDNVLTLGAAADLADVDFASNSEVGTLTATRTVDGSGLLAGIFGEAPDDLFNTSLETRNRAFGLYFSDTLSLTDRAHVTVSGRFNHARVEIDDRLGTSLDGNHDFSRFNVGAGAVYQIADAMSVFGRYTEANRAPTAAELSCADPEEPCRVPNAFVSDPPLEQAVARSVEGGLRGRVTLGGSVDWSIAFYRTGISDDILFVASPELIGTGFFQNAGDTRRIGLDAEITGQVARTGWYASYGLVQATFESSLELPGNAEVNSATTEDGVLMVQPGDRLAGIPRHSFKAGVRQAVLDTWDVAVETVAASSRVFVGDEGNDQEPLPGYGIVNLRSAYRFTDHLEVFVRIENLLDHDYSTFGALAELEVFLSEVPDATDPRFLGPGAPRSGFAGLRIAF